MSVDYVPSFVCEACGRDRRTAFSCDAEARPGVSLYGRDMPAEHYQPLDYELMPARCDRCGVMKGAVHHVHCVKAACLTHDWAQRLECPCDYPDAPPFDDMGRPW